MAESNETARKIQELQVLEHNHQAFLMQKQTIQIEMNEVLNALEEISKAKGEIYKVLGGVMIESSRENVLKDLEEKKKVLGLKISTIEKQEKIIDDKISSVRKEVASLVGKNKK